MRFTRALVLAGVAMAVVSPRAAFAGVAAGARARQSAAAAPRAQAGQGANRAGGPPPGSRAQGAGRPGGPNGQGITAEQAEQQFDRVMANQARRVLNLDAQSFEAFRPRLQMLQMVRRQTQRKRMVLVRELGLLDSGGTPADEATINAKLDALKAFDADTVQQIQHAYADIDEVLTPAQRARFRVLEQRMAQQKQDLIARARQQANAPSLAPPPAP